jgi:hypothetical protein
LATLQGHTEGILSISWCPTDTSLLLSCGKDNRTLIWDLFQLQPVYELPFKGPNTSEADHQHVFGELATSASQRRYHVAWSPCLPAITSTSSFDRRVQFYSTTGFQSKLGRAPKWLRRPVCATFGFGGKFVMINNTQSTAQAQHKKGGPSSKINVFQLTEDEDLVNASDEFHTAATSGQYKELCDLKSATPGLESAQVWKLMRVICFGTNAREELLTFLGFDSSKISASATAYLETSQQEKDGDASNIFSSAMSDSTSLLESSSLNISQREKLARALQNILSSESAEPTIRKALIVGNFEMAVECCLQAGLLAEALLLAQCGGQELRIKTQAAFFERQRHQHPFLNVLHAVIKNQLMEFVMSSDLDNWKETLALLSTYGKSDEFSSLCEALANRLENENKDKKSAALCFMCAANVHRTIKYWTEEFHEANLKLGQIDTRALQDYVEKILVFTQANPVSDLGEEPGSLFARYADLLASHGRLASAANYLRGDSHSIRVLTDRIYHAGNKPAGSRPPAFPFEKVALETQQAVQSNLRSEHKVLEKKVADTKPKTNFAVDPSSSTANRLNPSTSVPDSNTMQSTQTSTLPAGWVQLFDPANNRYYYANQQTGQSQWDQPVPNAVVASPNLAVPHSKPEVPDRIGASFHNQPVQGNTAMFSQPSKVQDFHSPKPTAVLETKLEPEVVPASSYVPGPEGDCVIALGQMIEAIAGRFLFVSLTISSSSFLLFDPAGNLNPAERKQIVMLRSNYQILNEKLQKNEISPEVLQKLSNLTDYLCNKNYQGANAVQTVRIYTYIYRVCFLLLHRN